MAFDTHVCRMFEFEGIHHSSSKLISARNEASKNIQKLCAKNKRYHAQNEHTSRIRKWKAAQNDDQNDDRTMTIFLVSKSLQTHPHREPKRASLLVRNYSIHFHCCCSCCDFFFCCCLLCCFRFFFFSQSFAHFMSTNTKPSRTIGDTQKRWPFQPRPFADAIGLVRCSYVSLMHVPDIHAAAPCNFCILRSTVKRQVKNMNTIVIEPR